jgi:Zn finger protein HypA/HybF involved in hydrogenase expression
MKISCLCDNCNHSWDERTTHPNKIKRNCPNCQSKTFTVKAIITDSQVTEPTELGCVNNSLTESNL